MSGEKQMADAGTHHCVSEFVSFRVRAPTAKSDHCDIEPFGAIGDVVVAMSRISMIRAQCGIHGVPVMRGYVI